MFIDTGVASLMFYSLNLVMLFTVLKVPYFKFYPLLALFLGMVVYLLDSSNLLGALGGYCFILLVRSIKELIDEYCGETKDRTTDIVVASSYWGILVALSLVEVAQYVIINN